jgi:hypothetical protein
MQKLLAQFRADRSNVKLAVKIDNPDDGIMGLEAALKWCAARSEAETVDIKCRHRDDGRGRCIDCGRFL